MASSIWRWRTLVSDTVSILLGTGTGSFGAKTDFGTGASPLSVAVGDFNGDGKLDLAVANPVSNTVSILLNATSNCRVDTNIRLFYQTDPLPEVPQLHFGGMQKDGCRTNNFGCALLTSANMCKVFWWFFPLLYSKCARYESCNAGRI